jgi:hypothetical protein
MLDMLVGCGSALRTCKPPYPKDTMLLRALCGPEKPHAVGVFQGVACLSMPLICISTGLLGDAPAARSDMQLVCLELRLYIGGLT